MKKIILTLIVATSLLTVVAQENRRGELKLKNGKTIKGNLVEKSENGDVILEVSDGTEYQYDAEEVRGFRFLKNDKFSNRKKGYVGLSIGPSIPVGDFGSRTQPGLNISVVNFGILFGDYVGICATWFGGANSTQLQVADEWNSWSYGGISIGPLISFPISKRFEIDLKPMIGYSVTRLPDNQYLFSEEGISLSYSANAMLRFHLGGRVSLTADATYFHTEPEFEDLGFIQNISTMSYNIGFAIRFK